MNTWNWLGVVGLIVLLYGVLVILPWRVGMFSFRQANLMLAASIAFTAVAVGFAFLVTA